MQVKEIMAYPAVTAPDTALVEDVAGVIMDRRVGCVPIVDVADELVGLITMSDFARDESHPQAHFRSRPIFTAWVQSGRGAEVLERQGRRPAREIMQSPVVTVDDNDDVQVALNRMAEHGLSRLPVVRDGKVVGVVSERDLLRLMLRGR